MGVGAIRLYDAQQQAKWNAATRSGLKLSHEQLLEQNTQELEQQNAARAQTIAGLLTPFGSAFKQIRHIDIAEVARLHASDNTSFCTPELAAVRLVAAASFTALATSAAAGFGASAAATAAVTAFATASTGTAISSLSGAAATSATMAWLGGGTVAAGGGGVAAGGLVLTALTAGPAILVAGAFLHHQGNKQLRKQRELASELSRTRAELQTMLEQWTAIRACSEAVREVLVRLVTAAGPRLAWLQDKVRAETDYRQYSPLDKADLAVIVGLATTTVAVMKVDLFDDQMFVTALSGEVVTAATEQLDQLNLLDAIDV